MITFWDVCGVADVGEVRHFQAVGHVTGETHVENGCTDSLVLYDVHYV